MKILTKTAILLSILGISLNAGFMDIIKDNINSMQNHKISNTKSMPNGEISTALKEVLSIGVKDAVSTLGKDGGFLNNPAFKIPLPKNLQKAAQIVRKAGGEKYVKELEEAINHAAEKAVPKTANIFLDAISSMSFQDAQKILNGGDNAATNYFKEKTQNKLIKAISTIVKESMKESSVASYYKSFNQYYSKYAKGFMQNSQIGSLAKSFGVDNYLPSSNESDLESYVTSKTIDRLFKAISQKERLIRENPAFRTTDILKKVFGK